MKELSLSEIKKIELDILVNFHEFCKENNLKYFLAYGTLLGAIRHKGFIPWDDDIDVVMPRKDYRVFISKYNYWAKKKYNIVSLDFRNDYYLCAAKLIDPNTILKENVNQVIDIGVFIDVFPLDFLTSDFKSACKHMKRIERMYWPIVFKQIEYGKNKPLLKRIAFKLGHQCFKRTNISKRLLKIDKVSQKFNFLEDSRYCGLVCFRGTYGVKEILESSWFNDCVEIEFEGKFFYAPYEYKKVLAHLYGDYMSLPPIEKRVTHHSFVAYIK